MRGFPREGSLSDIEKIRGLVAPLFRCCHHDATINRRNLFFVRMDDSTGDNKLHGIVNSHVHKNDLVLFIHEKIAGSRVWSCRYKDRD